MDIKVFYFFITQATTEVVLHIYTKILKMTNLTISIDGQILKIVNPFDSA